MENDEYTEDVGLETENNGQEADTSDDETATDDTDWEAEAKRAQADAAKYRRLLEKSQKPKEATPEATEYGYAEKAYLNSLGITGKEAHDFVFSIASKTGGDLDSIASDPYVKSKLDGMKTEAATPSGTRRSRGSARNEVEYWLAKGEDDLPPKDQPELLRKVIRARIERENSRNRFGTAVDL